MSTHTNDALVTTRALPFFATVLGITWFLQLPALLASLGALSGGVERFMPFAGLGAFGPLIAAVLFARGEPGGVRALFRPIRVWRVNAVWYLIAFGASGAIFVAGMAAYTLLAGRDAGPWFYPPSDGQRIAAMVFFSVGEEVGWRGYALPRLQQRHGALRASVVVGLVWGLWHVPMFVMSGTSPALMALLILVFMPAGSVVFTWIYNHTRASLLLSIFAHMGAHLNNPHQTLGSDVTPAVVHTVAYVVVACALVLFDRKVFAQRT